MRRQKGQEQDGEPCTGWGWRGVGRQGYHRHEHLQGQGMWFGNYTPEALGGRVTRRGTSVWRRDRVQCVNSMVQHSVHNARGGLGAEGG